MLLLPANTTLLMHFLTSILLCGASVCLATLTSQDAVDIIHSSKEDWKKDTLSTIAEEPEFASVVEQIIEDTDPEMGMSRARPPRQSLRKQVPKAVGTFFAAIIVIVLYLHTLGVTDKFHETMGALGNFSLQLKKYEI